MCVHVGGGGGGGGVGVGGSVDGPRDLCLQYFFTGLHKTMLFPLLAAPPPPPPPRVLALLISMLKWSMLGIEVKTCVWVGRGG